MYDNNYYHHKNLFQAEIIEGYHHGNYKIRLSGESLISIDLEPSSVTYKFDEVYSVMELYNSTLFCDCKFINFINALISQESLDLQYNMKFKLVNVTCENSLGFKTDNVRGISPKHLYCKQNDCPRNCSCLDNPESNILIMDCKNQNFGTIDGKFWNSYNNKKKNRTIKLDLSHNNLTEISASSLDRSGKATFLGNVTFLDLSNNAITKVTVDLLPNNLNELKLHNNKLSRLEDAVITELGKRTFKNLTLYNNPWVCECSTISFIEFIKNNARIHFEVNCEDSRNQVWTTNKFELCWLFLFEIVIFVAILVGISGIIVAYYYKHKKKIQIWLYSKEWCRWIVTVDDLDNDREYDAFVSFSHKDEEFVRKEIVQKLEKGRNPYKLCLHDRDWLAGEFDIKFEF